MPTTLPQTMRAWQYTSTTTGLENTLKLNSSTPLPSPPPSSHHLVRITATALNPIDYKVAELLPNFIRNLALHHRPGTPGLDICGTIIRPALNSPLKEGQRVFGVAGDSPIAGGGLAEYASVKAENAVAVPEGLASVDAATVAVAGLTAYQSIVPHVKPGSRVFINGGSGGVGVFGVQIAKVVGCHVTTTCSGRNVELVRRLGADVVVDYTAEKDLVGALKRAGGEGGFDHVVDNVGTNRELVWRCREFLKRGGTYVLVAGDPSVGGFADSFKRKLWPGFLGGVRGTVVGFWPKPEQEDLKQIGEWMAEGKVQAVVDERFAFERAEKAVERLKSGRARGKVVVEVAEEKTAL